MSQEEMQPDEAVGKFLEHLLFVLTRTRSEITALRKLLVSQGVLSENELRAAADREEEHLTKSDQHRRIMSEIRRHFTEEGGAL